MNLIKALEGLSSKPDGKEAAQPSPPPQQKTNPPDRPERETEVPNVMASVIERHELISNRVRTNAKRN